jgi:hypothetical protein
MINAITTKIAPATGSNASTAKAIANETVAWSLGNDASVVFDQGWLMWWLRYGRREAAAARELPLAVAARAAEEPERGGDHDHQRDAHLLDVAEEGPDPVVVERDVVDRLVEAPVHRSEF